MGPELVLLLFSDGGTADQELSELHASRLAHLQVGTGDKGWGEGGHEGGGGEGGE